MSEGWRLISASAYLGREEKGEAFQKGEPMFRVLVVDDDFFILSGLRKMLERDYEVKTASDGETALSIAERFRPNVVFVDYLLGYENGLDVIRELRKLLPDAALILMTGSVDGDLKDQISAADGDGFLAKEELALVGSLLSRIERAA